MRTISKGKPSAGLPHEWGLGKQYMRTTILQIVCLRIEQLPSWLSPLSRRPTTHPQCLMFAKWNCPPSHPGLCVILHIIKLLKIWLTKWFFSGNGKDPGKLSGRIVDSDMHDVARFLNRLLGLSPNIQNRWLCMIHISSKSWLTVLIHSM